MDVSLVEASFSQLGYTVTRVMADYTYDEYATYTNSVIAGGVALIPTYSSSSRNRAALDAYAAHGYTPSVELISAGLQRDGDTEVLAIEKVFRENGDPVVV